MPRHESSPGLYADLIQNVADFLGLYCTLYKAGCFSTKQPTEGIDEFVMASFVVLCEENNLCRMDAVSGSAF